MPAKPGHASQAGLGHDPERAPVVLRVSGDLDLHTFRPRDLPELLPAWFEECRDKGILTIRVIHGKGTGTLRTGVHRLLEKMTLSAPSPDVLAASPAAPRKSAALVKSWTFPAPEAAGGWGATVVQLL